MELLPCPFCGSKDVSSTIFVPNCEYVRCNNCNAMHTNLIEWNTRHSTWISVKDRLPNKDETVLCFGKYHNIGFYDYDDEIWREEGEYVEITVTHWQPLPQSPKEIE